LSTHEYCRTAAHTPERDREPPGDDARRAREHQRVGEALAQHHEHRLVPRERLAEVEMEQHVLEVHAVLHPPRLIEPEAAPHRIEHLGEMAGILGELVEEVAGRELQQQERQRGDPEQQRQDLQTSAAARRSASAALVLRAACFTYTRSMFHSSRAGSPTARRCRTGCSRAA
jgi:hypothetical protein